MLVNALFCSKIVFDQGQDFMFSKIMQAPKRSSISIFVICIIRGFDYSAHPPPRPLHNGWTQPYSTSIQRTFNSSPMHYHLQQNIQTNLSIVFTAGDTKPDLDQSVTFVIFFDTNKYLYSKNEYLYIRTNIFKFFTRTQVWINICMENPNSCRIPDCSSCCCSSLKSPGLTHYTKASTISKV